MGLPHDTKTYRWPRRRAAGAGERLQGARENEDRPGTGGDVKRRGFRFRVRVCGGLLGLEV